MYVKSLRSCLTLCDSMDSNLPGSSVHGILQARILEWVFSSSGYLLQGIFSTQGSNLHVLDLLPLAGGFFTIVPPGKLVKRNKSSFISSKLI